jgi:hypothetical protein
MLYYYYYYYYYFFDLAICGPICGLFHPLEEYAGPSILTAGILCNEDTINIV